MNSIHAAVLDLQRELRKQKEEAKKDEGKVGGGPMPEEVDETG